MFRLARLNIACCLFKRTLTDSSNFSDIEICPQTASADGVRDPETEEDPLYFAEAQQAQKSARPKHMAMAEQMKAENQAVKTQLDHEVAVYNAETQRIDVISKAEQGGATIALKQAELVGKQIESAQKVKRRPCRLVYV